MIRLIFEEGCEYEHKCGDGYTDLDYEGCEDGNMKNGDGCSKYC